MGLEQCLNGNFGKFTCQVVVVAIKKSHNWADQMTSLVHNSRHLKVVKIDGQPFSAHHNASERTKQTDMALAMRTSTHQSVFLLLDTINSPLLPWSTLPYCTMQKNFIIHNIHI